MVEAGGGAARRGGGGGAAAAAPAAAAQHARPHQPWRVAVCFADHGLLRAEADGAIAWLMPEDALHIITHPAGDPLFRVVARREVAVAAGAGAGADDPAPADGGAADGAADGGTADGCAQRALLRVVEVENRAPVRVLACKFWAVSRVLFTVRLAPPPTPAPQPRRSLAGVAAAKRGAAAEPPGRMGSSVAFSLVSSVRRGRPWGKGGRGRRGGAAAPHAPARGRGPGARPQTRLCARCRLRRGADLRLAPGATPRTCSSTWPARGSWSRCARTAARA
jgi:hypothetical protein